MKKIIVLLFITLSLTLTTFAKSGSNPLWSFEKVISVCLVVDSDALDGENVVECGNKDFVYMSKEEGMKVKCKTYALQFYLQDVTLGELLNLLKATVVSYQEFEGLEIYYCYTPYEQDCVFLENKKVNLQIVFKNGEVVLGMPLILTGY